MHPKGLFGAIIEFCNHPKKETLIPLNGKMPPKFFQYKYSSLRAEVGAYLVSVSQFG
jgi:hypothetical protein